MTHKRLMENFHAAARLSAGMEIAGVGTQEP